MFDLNLLNSLYVTRLTFASISEYPKNRCFEIIRAPNLFGIIFGVEGSLQFNHNGNTYICDKNHAVLIPADSSYSYCSLEDNTQLALINFYASQNFVVNEFQVLELKNPEILLADHNEIQRQFVSNSVTSFPQMMASFYTMIAHLIQNTKLSKEECSTWRITEYIDSNISNPDLTIADIAEAAGFSEVHFRKLFKNHYGISPKQYILNNRLHIAKKLLESTNDSISQIANRCGFSTIFYFSKLFKDKMGISPYEYRERHRWAWF